MHLDISVATCTGVFQIPGMIRTPVEAHCNFHLGTMLSFPFHANKDKRDYGVCFSVPLTDRYLLCALPEWELKLPLGSLDFFRLV